MCVCVQQIDVPYIRGGKNEKGGEIRRNFARPEDLWLKQNQVLFDRDIGRREKDQ